MKNPKAVIRRIARLARDPREVRRLLTLRCAHCGHRFRWMNDARHSFGKPGEVFHAPCIGYVTWMRKAAERLEVLRVATEVSGITASDMQEVMGQRDREGGWNVAGRVFRDLEAARNAEEQP